ncbi:MAG: M23 family metallopeptidase [Bacteroidales bacterium]|nr:M23 family metallopeptidase [Bacteroidales bacterium]
MATKKEKKKWYKKLHTTYRLVFLNEKSFEERFSFRLTRMHVITTLFSLAVIFIVLTFFLIAYTPLKEYIPGYPDINQKRELYHLNRTIDSLLQDSKQKDVFLTNIKNIIEDKDTQVSYKPPKSTRVSYDTIIDRKTKQDSILRAEFENETRFNLYPTSPEGSALIHSKVLIQDQNFFVPLDGIITGKFDILEKHYGIDIVASHNEAIKSVLDGTVILSTWTPETGNVIAIQHSGNLISVYKHCATLLKQEGDLVKAGDPIAIAGNTGELTTGPHLHFELWYNGNPVNPTDYINFK